MDSLPQLLAGSGVGVAYMGYMGHGSLKGSIHVDTTPLWWRCKLGRMAGIREGPALTAHYLLPRSSTILQNTEVKIKSGDFSLYAARIQRLTRALTGGGA